MTDYLKQFKQRLEALARWGQGIKYRGVVVSEEFWPFIEDMVQNGTIFRATREGNYDVVYTWWCRKTAAFPWGFTSNEPFLFIPLTVEAYERDWLGREASLLQRVQDRLMADHYLRTADVGRLVRVYEGNPLMGDVRVCLPGLVEQNIYYSSFDEVLAALERESHRQRPDFEAAVRPFRALTMANNPPERRWRGRLYFDDDGILKRANLSRCDRVVLYNERAFSFLSGRLLLRYYGPQGPYQIVGVGTVHGDVRLFPFLHRPTANKMNFARYALKWFGPEDLFLYFAHHGNQEELEILRAMATPPQVWGAINEPKLGRPEVTMSSGCSCGRRKAQHHITIPLVDGYGRLVQHVAERVFVEHEELWRHTRARYFNPGE